MEIKKIPLSLVIPSPMNPRKTFDEVELQELADNIEEQGLLQPITVREIELGNPLFQEEWCTETHYELICGERRFRAMRILSEKWAEMDAVAPKGESYNRFSEIDSIV
ncbi:MAG: ParB N-terminal domain-containing protein, partial [Muribaculum sp.]|nr:ParB N-terminal domain-containing protein [Muribaculum sp.]